MPNNSPLHIINTMNVSELSDFLPGNCLTNVTLKEEIFNLYLESKSITTFEGLHDDIILQKCLETLRSKIRRYVMEKSPNTLEEATDMWDRYVEHISGSPGRLKKTSIEPEMTNCMCLNNQMKLEYTVAGTVQTEDRITPDDRITTIIIRIKTENMSSNSNSFTIHLSNQPEMSRLTRLTNRRNHTIHRKRTIQSRTEQILHQINIQNHTTVVF